MMGSISLNCRIQTLLILDSGWTLILSKSNGLSIVSESNWILDLDSWILAIRPYFLRRSGFNPEFSLSPTLTGVSGSGQRLRLATPSCVRNQHNPKTRWRCILAGMPSSPSSHHKQWRSEMNKSSLIKPPKSILALDLGTRTGWALRTMDGRIVSGVEDFRPRRFEGGGMRYLRFTDWLVELAMHSHGINRVVFEEVRRHAGTDASHVYGGFLGTLTSWCEEHEIPYQGVPVGTIKRHATGKGNANKAAMIEAMRERGFDPADDNEADALALLGWAMEHRIGVAA